MNFRGPEMRSDKYSNGTGTESGTSSKDIAQKGKQAADKEQQKQ